MNYLVTGGAGFIGSNIAERLLTDGHKVVILDNFSTGLRTNIRELVHLNGDLVVIEGDLRDQNTCRDACKNIDYVLHQGALGSVPRSIEYPLNTNDNNVNGTLNILLSARDAGVKRVVFASSSSVYGSNPALPKMETMIPNPISPYAASKNICEMYARIFGELYGLETIALRYFNVFGRRQDPNSAYAAVIPIFVKQLLGGQVPTIHGDGEQSRDFSYVDNVIESNLLACTAPKEACGQVYNIACGERTSLNALYEKICQLLDKNVKPNYSPSRQGDVKHSLADISKAEKLLNYHPKFDVFHGLDTAIHWYVEQAPNWL
jgi:UDP-N-acetylglucosamine/UDP-N-acetylgalactosamine 4-epimerase